MTINPKRQGYYNLARFVGSAYGETSNLRCLTVFIPDGDEYTAQLLTLMNVAGTPAAWFTATDEERQQKSEIWQRAYRETLAAIEEGCMDCDGVADCIENDPAVQAAVISAAQGGGNPAGVPLSPANRGLDLSAGLNPECDPDVLWSICLGLVKWTDRLITDFFDEFEVFTNPVELAAAFSKLPVLDEIGSDAVADYINMTVESVQENYAADYNEEYEIALACELFCLCRSDCVVSVERVFQVLKTRVETQVGAIFTWSGLIDMLNDIVVQDIDVVDVADLIFCMAWGSVALANFLLNIQAGFQAIQRAIAVFDEGSNDWQALCTDCSEGVIVLATTSWEDAGSAAGIGVTEGVEYTLTVTGETGGYGGTPPYDADGISGSAPVSCFPLSTTNAGELAAYIEASPSGDWFNVGTGITFTADRTGVLRFAIADGCSGYANNEGQLVVSIEEV